MAECDPGLDGKDVHAALRCRAKLRRPPPSRQRRPPLCAGGASRHAAAEPGCDSGPAGEDAPAMSQPTDVSRRAAMLGAAASGALLWAGGEGALAQAGKPSELKVGITTFLSGPASVFGVPVAAGGRDAGGADQPRRRHRRRAAARLLRGRGARRRPPGRRVPPPRAERGGARRLRLHLLRLLPRLHAALRRAAQDHAAVGLRHAAHLRGGQAPLRLPHPGLRHARGPGAAALSAEDQARLPHPRRDQPGLRLGPRLLGAVEGRHGRAEARRARGGGDVPALRRHRLLHRDHPPAGDAART